MGNFLILGVCSYSKAVLRYLETLRKYYDGKVVLVLTDHEEKVEILERRYNIECKFRPEPTDFWKQTKEDYLCKQWKYVEEISNLYPDHYILRTDVWDVVFQDNPTDYVNQFADKCYICLEGIRNMDNKFQMSWYSNSKIFPLIATNQQLLNLPVINSGLLCCKGNLMKMFANEIYNNVYGTKLDQTELNISIMCKEYYSNMNEVKNFFSYTDGFLESINFSLQAKGVIKNKIFMTKNTNNKWCVVHENSNPKTYLDSIYPLDNYKE